MYGLIRCNSISRRTRVTQEKKYELVARKLAAAIASGEYAIGTILPTEIELAEQYDVSRATVRLSLSHLQKLGLISRKRHVGTRVEASTPPRGNSAYSQSIATIDDLLQYAAHTRRIVQKTERIVADAELAILLGCPPGKRWRLISSIREQPLGNGDPLCWTDVYVDEIYGDLVEECLPQHTGAISELIEANAGKQISEVVQLIKAVSIPPSLAKPLKVPLGTAGLEITRRYLDTTGKSVLNSFSTHPASQFTYEIHLLRHN